MRRFAILFVAVTMCGCQLFARKKTTSGWVVLDKARDAECAKWPLTERDLQVNELMLVRGSDGGPKGFLATGVRRDAKPMQYWAPFTGEVKIDKESLLPLSLGRGALLTGGTVIGDAVVAGVVQNAKGKATLELRNVRDNIVRFKGELVPTPIDSAGWLSTRAGAWLRYKQEDNEQGLAFLDFKAKDKVASRLVGTASYRDAPMVVTQTSGTGALAFWKEGESDRPFKVRTLGEDGTAGDAQVLDLAVVSQAESWAAASHGGTYYVAVIDGDSLIGQANLRVAAVGMSEGSPAIKWTKDAPLKDVHVTEPVFLSTSAGLQVLLLKWVDEESTIARYVVAGGTLGQPVFSGIFQKGARIVDAFSGKDPDDVYVVVRHREDTRWAFQICKL